MQMCNGTKRNLQCNGHDHQTVVADQATWTQTSQNTTHSKTFVFLMIGTVFGFTDNEPPPPPAKWLPKSLSLNHKLRPTHFPLSLSSLSHCATDRPHFPPFFSSFSLSKGHLISFSFISPLHVRTNIFRY